MTATANNISKKQLLQLGLLETNVYYQLPSGELTEQTLIRQNIVKD